jgi:beta-glucosidase
MKILHRLLMIFIIINISLIGLSAVKDPNISKKVEDLLSKMTLEEKVGQLVQCSGWEDRYMDELKNGKIGSFLNITGAEDTNRIQKIAVENTRLHIPLLFGIDAVHGYRTIFPIPLAEACSWDPELIKQEAIITAKETRASGIHWTFAPMVDIARDPRWGRISEGSGEDPYLGSIFSSARVEGFQGTDLYLSESIIACLKHYVAYGAVESGKDYNKVDISDRTLREVYLPPFKSGVDKGALTIMSAFNSLNGIPSSANEYTLKTILRQELGFKGLVLSDWSAIGELVQHGYAKDLKDAAYKAFKSGIDMDMQSGAYDKFLGELVRQNLISEKDINDSARRVLTLKFQLGLFEDPYHDPGKETETVLSAQNVIFAREISKRSIVLLKNDKNILPLKKDLINNIAVIGPLADKREEYLGAFPCTGKERDVVTVLEGIKNKLGEKVKISYSKGCTIESENTKGMDEAVKLAKSVQYVILVVGETTYMSGEAASRAYLDLPGKQLDLMKEIYKVNKNLIVVLMNGRPLTIPWLDENVPAILESWQLGVQAGNAVADVIFGDYNPSGKLVVSFPRTIGQIPVYYSYDSTGRPESNQKWTSKYLDEVSSPLYSFGYGLSYTTFEYGDLAINKLKIKKDEKIKVSASITNTGKLEGEEIVQLYIRDLTSGVIRPVKELKGFKKIALKPGEKKTVEFELGPNEFSFLDKNMKRIVEPGTFSVWIAKNSDEGLEGSFEIIE